MILLICFFLFLIGPRSSFRETEDTYFANLVPKIKQLEYSNIVFIG